jgi:tRNA A-37 threonylcarbamoyl transferase component Bud32
MIGQKIGNYTVERELGRGGFGVVYLGRHEDVGRTVAIKMLRPELVSDPAIRARVLGEYQILDQIHHPHVVSLYDVQIFDEQLCLIMEYLEGPTLSEQLQSGPLSVPAVAELGVQVLSGLAAVHRSGIIHRDIKAENIKLTPTGAKLFDFGIALSDGVPRMTEVGILVGSAGYIAPELWSGQPPTPASDVYALGLCLREALEGALPFPDDLPPAGYLKIHCQTGIPPLGDHSDIPRWLAEALDQATRRDPTARFASAQEMFRVFKHNIDLSVALDLRRLPAGKRPPPPRGLSAPLTVPTPPAGIDPDAQTVLLRRQTPPEPAPPESAPPETSPLLMGLGCLSAGFLALVALLAVGMATRHLLTPEAAVEPPDSEPVEAVEAERVAVLVMRNDTDEEISAFCRDAESHQQVILDPGMSREVFLSTDGLNCDCLDGDGLNILRWTPQGEAPWTLAFTPDMLRPEPPEAPPPSAHRTTAAPAGPTAEPTRAEEPAAVARAPLTIEVTARRKKRARGVTVLIDGRAIGEAPVQRYVSPGRHQVRWQGDEELAVDCAVVVPPEGVTVRLDLDQPVCP